MKAKVIEHALSMLIVACGFLVLALIMGRIETSRQSERTKAIERYLQLDFLDFDDPLHRTLLKETLDIYYPDSTSRNDSIIREIEKYRQEQFASQSYKKGIAERGLSAQKLLKLADMFARFILIYLIVMVLGYYIARSLAILRFVKMKQGRTSYLADALRSIAGSKPGWRGSSLYLKVIVSLAKALLAGVAYAVLFTPAYVIGYSIKSTFETDSYLLMIALGIVSNGLLVNYANKFYTFLVAESRKGYVQTAIVKNLHASYAWGTPDGVPYRAILQPKGLFPSHVFRHIYLNSRYQFLPSLKEYASFLITGLIIIEMALNIQGHLGYELLQNILYKEYDVALFIIVGIFFVIKGTEIVVDVWFHFESGKHENRA